jgi:hypothetical protein
MNIGQVLMRSDAGAKVPVIAPHTFWDYFLTEIKSDEDSSGNRRLAV